MTRKEKIIYEVLINETVIRASYKYDLDLIGDDFVIIKTYIGGTWRKEIYATADEISEFKHKYDHLAQ